MLLSIWKAFLGCADKHPVELQKRFQTNLILVAAGIKEHAPLP
jgi:hypothetical protein